MSGTQARVLVAVAPQARPRLAAILRECEVVWAASFREAADAVARERYDLVVVGSHFDESTVLHLLEKIQAANPRLVCVRALPFTRLGSGTMDAFRAACEALGARRVIDLLAYPDDEQGNAAIRRLLYEEIRHIT